MSCPVCGSINVWTFVERRDVPVHQNIICHDKESAIRQNKGSLSMTVCNRCGFIFNKDFNSSLLSYCQDYDNTQTCSEMYQEYIVGQISGLINIHNVNNCNIIEVGCGKGYYIKGLVAEGYNNRGIGFDPSYEGELEAENGKLRFERRFYDETCTDIFADVVICRHVIEHVQDPVKMLKSIKSTLSGSKNARVFFETPCVEWILKNRVIWDFFYEHCSLFSVSSLKTAFEISGFKVIDIHHLFGGQYLWLEALPAEDAVEVTYAPGDIFKLAKDFGENESYQKTMWKEKITNSGQIAVWGAGAKGVTFLNLIDQTGERIDSVIDINPNKQGNYIPGSGHEILGVEQIKGRGIKSIILMNPNYDEENKRIINGLGLTINWL